jgi:hypothetical protein
MIASVRWGLEHGPLGGSYPRWEVSGPVAGVRLRECAGSGRVGGQREVIVHGSPKAPGTWQATWLEDGVPTGDLQSKTLPEALRETPPGRWEVVEVRAAGGGR